MTDPRTQIQAINAELQEIEHLFASWDSDVGDRPEELTCLGGQTRPLRSQLVRNLDSPDVQTSQVGDRLEESESQTKKFDDLKPPKAPEQTAADSVLLQPSQPQHEAERQQTARPSPSAPVPPLHELDLPPFLDARHRPQSFQSQVVTAATNPTPPHPLTPSISEREDPTSLVPSSDVDSETRCDSTLDAKLQELQAQAEYVNHLAEQQETALLTLKAIAEAAEFEAIRTGVLHQPQQRSSSPRWLHQPEPAKVSMVMLDAQGRWQIQSRPVDWFQAERDAQAAADQIRALHRARSPILGSPLSTNQPIASSREAAQGTERKFTAPRPAPRFVELGATYETRNGTRGSGAIAHPTDLGQSQSVPQSQSSRPDLPDSRTAGGDRLDLAALKNRMQTWMTQRMAEAQQAMQTSGPRSSGRSRHTATRLGRLPAGASRNGTPRNGDRPTHATRRGKGRSPAVNPPMQLQVFFLWIVIAAGVRVGLNIVASLAPSLMPVAILGLVCLGGVMLYQAFYR
jgi:hypothetical protein